MTPPLPQARTPSSLPVVALVFSVLGFCLPPLLLVGIVLGIVALVQAKGAQAPAIVAVVLPVLAVPVIGILAAIAIPNFVKYGARAKQSEVKANLKAAYVGQMALHSETHRFSLHPAEIGFAPELGNRYLYAFAATGPIEANSGAPSKEAVGVGSTAGTVTLADLPAELAATLGLRGDCPKCEITMVGAANLDSDPGLDVWSISTAERPGIPAGMPHHERDDLLD